MFYYTSLAAESAQIGWLYATAKSKSGLPAMQLQTTLAQVQQRTQELKTQLGLECAPISHKRAQLRVS